MVSESEYIRDIKTKEDKEMELYNYDKITHEFTNTSIAFLNPEATKVEGKEVWLVPPNSTLKKPPKAKPFKVAVFENDTWVVKDDYRGRYVCNETLDVHIVQEIGALPDGYILITDAQAAQIVADPLFFIVQDGELIENPNYEQAKEAERKQHIAMLAMTKYDFFKCVCLPNGINYQTLMSIVNSNDEIAAAWNLCGHIYRGDTTLTANISNFIPTMTEEALDNIFEQYGKIINE